MSHSSKATRFATIVAKELALDAGKMTATSIITTQGRDRSDDIVVTAGIDLANHAKNPVVLLDHRTLIGRAASPDGEYSVKLGEGVAVATTWFSESIPESVQAFRLIEEGILKGASIGFVPKLASLFDADDRVGVLFEKVELVEYSHVVIPDNADALTIAVQKSRVGGDAMLPAIKLALAPFIVTSPATTINVEGTPPTDNNPVVETKEMDDKRDEYADIDADKGAETPPAEEPTAEPADDLPPGAALLTGVYDRLLELSAFLAESGSSRKQENPDILSFADDFVPELDALCGRVAELHDSLYPDLDPMGKAEDGDGVEESDDENDEPEGKSIRERLAKRIDAFRKSRKSILEGAADAATAELRAKLAEKDNVIAALEKRLDAIDEKFTKLLRQFRAARAGR